MNILCKLSVLFILICITACERPEPPVINDQGLYFPPSLSPEWETINPDSLSWNTTGLNELYSFLDSNGTRAFLILKNGKIVIEKYFGKNILNIGDFERESFWYWASAGKTITSILVGIAQEESLLSIYESSSKYLGNGWTSMDQTREDNITIRHQLCMTTGLDYNTTDLFCTDPECLKYRKDPGEQWYYHNAPYTLLHEVISNASGINIGRYTEEKLASKIGMSGEWVKSGFNNTYWSNPRDMARFGLLILNKGTWDNNKVISDSIYFHDMINSSQDLNPSYGYLWWLNGKSSIMFPGISIPVNVSLAPNAPADMIVAAGKNGQFLDIIPEWNIVVVRMGEAPDGSLVPIQFHNDMWDLIMGIIIG